MYPRNLAGCDMILTETDDCRKDLIRIFQPSRDEDSGVFELSISPDISICCEPEQCRAEEHHR